LGGGGVSNSTFGELEGCRRGGVTRDMTGSAGGGGQGDGDDLSKDEGRASAFRRWASSLLRGALGDDSRGSSADEMGRMMGGLTGGDEGGSSSLAV
jgi:hypothetical protein